jgi:hypothetical protein
VTIIEVSDSFASRAFAADIIGWKRFSPSDNLPAILVGIAIELSSFYFYF